MPPGVKIFYISTPKDIEHLSLLDTEPVIGMDTEWKRGLNQFDEPKVSILQLAGHNHAFVIDMLRLHKEPLLD